MVSLYAEERKIAIGKSHCYIQSFAIYSMDESIMILKKE